MTDYSFVVHDHDPYYVQALVLAKVVEKILLKNASFRLSSRPDVQSRPVVSFMNRARVSGLEKFDQKTMVSVVNFYRTVADESAGKAAGAIILYVPEDFVFRLIKQLEYDIEESDGELGIMDACGTLCNLIAGNFKNGLSKIGYHPLVMSAFSTYENTPIDGVAFDSERKEIFEISFEIEGLKRIVVDLTMGKIPHETDI